MPGSIKIDVQGMEEVRSLLRDLKEKAPRALMRGMNKTLAGVRTDMTRAAVEVLNVKQADVRKGITLNKASLQRLSASAVSAGRPLSLAVFSARQTKKGVTVKVLKANPRKEIKHAFLGTMMSGHQGIFWRKWTGPRKRMRPGIAYGGLPKQYRFPIEERFGPAVQDALQHPGVIADLEQKAGDRLVKNMAHEADYLLKQKDSGDS